MARVLVVPEKLLLSSNCMTRIRNFSITYHIFCTSFQYCLLLQIAYPLTWALVCQYLHTQYAALTFLTFCTSMDSFMHPCQSPSMKKQYETEFRSAYRKPKRHAYFSQQIPRQSFYVCLPPKIWRTYIRYATFQAPWKNSLTHTNVPQIPFSIGILDLTKTEQNFRSRSFKIKKTNKN